MQPSESPAPLASPDPAVPTVEVEPVAQRRNWLQIALVSGLLSLVAVVLWVVWLLQPATTTAPISVTINPGSSVSQAVAQVTKAGVVRSETALYVLTQTLYRNETIEAGTYTFAAGASVFTVAEHLMTSIPADELTAVTFPEGITVATMAAIAAERLPEVTAGDFIEHALTVEGELWPETYFVPLAYTTEQLVTLLRNSQDAILLQYQDAIASSTLNEQEVLILASILEREANDETSMRTVAGILLNRLAADMPLQADATIEYVLETPLGELPPGALAENLREIDSPYNTYRYRGLPPTPIGNPGEMAVAAVISPITSEYYFYLTDPDGVFHYATTYDQHLINIDRYLR